jgi:ParB family chromosome partitioning protein
LTQDQLAEKVSKSRTAITNAMRLLKLTEKVQTMVIQEQLSAGHARALLAIEDETVQYELAQKIFDEGLSVRETEKLIKDYNGKKDDNKTPTKEQDTQKSAVVAVYKEKETEIENHLKTKVSIEDKGNKGKIIISYDSLEEFERLYEILNK